MGELGDYIKSYREERGLSLREFGRRADLSHTMIDVLEKGYDPRTGKKANVTIESLVKIAKAMGVSPTMLFSLYVNHDLDIADEHMPIAASQDPDAPTESDAEVEAIVRRVIEEMRKEGRHER
ncbi:MAG: helix-turn-helix transcriptional regulator [Bacillota bacterium]|jgi:transcriptional regulator with XRE-family HTH domain|nr:helix-turn-helix transcriptional regulator [Bacillota bacterium]